MAVLKFTQLLLFFNGTWTAEPTSLMIEACVIEPSTWLGFCIHRNCWGKKKKIQHPLKNPGHPGDRWWPLGKSSWRRMGGGHELSLTLRLNNLIERNFKWNSLEFLFFFFNNWKQKSCTACIFSSLMTESDACLSVGPLNPDRRSCDAVIGLT